MVETDYLSEHIEWIALNFVERNQTPRKFTENSIQHYLVGVLLLNIVILEESSVERDRTTVYNWVQKADLQPAGGENPDRVTIDQKLIRVNNEEYWLYAAVDPETSRILHARLFPTHTTLIGREFLTELCEKHDVSTASQKI